MQLSSETIVTNGAVMKKLDTNQDLKYPGESPIFFIGASAGGVKLFEEIAERVPSNFPATIVFIIHRNTAHNERTFQLESILRKKARLEVKVPEEGEEPMKGTIYLPKDRCHLCLKNGKFHHSKEPKGLMWSPAIDVLFKSAARELKNNAVCVLCTGGLQDGVEGLIETTKNGGITIAQSPEDAFSPILPLNALMKDHPVYVAPGNKMAHILCELAGHKCFSDQQEVLKKALQKAVEEKASKGNLATRVSRV